MAAVLGNGLQLALFGVLFVLAAASAARAEPLVVRDTIVVAGDVVRLGDVFRIDDAQRAAQPVAKAPAPGRSVAITPRWLAETLARQGVAWTPAPHLKRITVTREAQVVPAAQLERLIVEALEARAAARGGLSAPARRWLVTLADPRDRFAPLDASLAPVVDSLHYDPRSRRFEAAIQLTADAEPVRVTGQGEPAVALVSAARAVPRGARLQAQALTLAYVPQSRAPADALQRLEEAAGQAARRALRPGDVVRAVDVEAPAAILRGEMATLSFQKGRLTLTVRARAQETAPVGALARFYNLQSNRVIEAQVTGPGAARVSP